MKKTIKHFFVSLSAIAIGALMTNNIFAMTPTWINDAKFSRGVSKAYYYVDSSASSFCFGLKYYCLCRILGYK